ncbi:APG6-domain-containing protein [Nadsonia fulvescens var. elongata DSM 6958]|uniref:APG6-domain-containing protein n=1 Tax=Nadsonia fulvescens var. elongata DSM 6958 TaxID=857566 RepID=A0A1E3PGM4_9ASCO|nr:APG6-domain-containing protein [Nadsonia fulvescens var. elongata DSM 6958]
MNPFTSNIDQVKHNDKAKTNEGNSATNLPVTSSVSDFTTSTVTRPLEAYTNYDKDSSIGSNHQHQHQQDRYQPNTPLQQHHYHNQDQQFPYQCRRCHQAMIIHDSLKDLTFNQYQMLHNLSNDYKSSGANNYGPLAASSPTDRATCEVTKQPPSDSIQNQKTKIGKDPRTSRYLDQINELIFKNGPSSDSNTRPEPIEFSTVKEEDVIVSKGTETGIAKGTAPSLVSHSPLTESKVVASNSGNDNGNNNSGGESSYVMLTESQLPSKGDIMGPRRDTQASASNSGKPHTNENRNNRNESSKRSPDYYQPSTRLINLDNLFSILSDNSSSINYPICVNCCDLITDGLKLKFNNALKEKDLFVRFLNKINQEMKLSDDQAETTAATETASETSTEVNKLKLEISQIKTATVQDINRLESLETEKVGLEAELRQLQLQVNEIARSESLLSQISNTHTRQLAMHYQTLSSLEQYHTSAVAQLSALVQTNVYNDAFCIGHDGYFGTINGLRLGRSKDRYVEWTEINAALGQTMLLLNMVVVKLGIKLKGYRLKPMGNFSKIEKFEKVAEQTPTSTSNSISTSISNSTPNPTPTPTTTTSNGRENGNGEKYKITTLDVFSSGGEYTLERLFNHKKIDAGLVALLDILLQIGTFIELKDAPAKFPYKIHKDKIGGVSIKLSLSSTYDGWTMACKYLLTDCKWVLAHTITRG